MDVDAFTTARRGQWERLDELARRARHPRRLTGDEADELVTLYRHTATDLATAQAQFADAALAARLSRSVLGARAAVTGPPEPAARIAARFLFESLPAALYRAARWWVPTALVTSAIMAAFAHWVATDPGVQRALLPPSAVRQLVQHDFRDYYSSQPAGSFAASVWTNNAEVAAATLTLGVLLGVPVLYVLLQNAVNVGVSGGYLAAAGKTSLFLGLILPHGMLELTAVYVAAGTGLRLGWTVISPGPVRRADALAAQGHELGAIALGLVGVLAVSGIIEAFVTPSGLPTAGRLAIGAAAEGAFLSYVAVLGRRAVTRQSRPAAFTSR